jgi:tetratricopeptide (TPR) repeat protein
VYDVSPLSLGSEDASPTGDPADALALFEQVAKGVDPQFRLAPHHDDVLAICRAVDGLPLAIELAAGHVRTLPPQLLRARLGARLASDSSAARGVPDRHRTVAATIDWSLQLLGEDERDLFVRLGVFAGAVPLDAVEQVCGSPGRDVVEALSRLVDHSLVRRVDGPRGEVRFVLLELLKERARELLAGEPVAEVELVGRHIEYVASFLDDLDESRWSDDADRWIEMITGLLAEVRLAHARAQDLQDIGAAARITAGMGTYWHREGHHGQGRRWVAHALEHQDELDEYLVGRVELGAGFVQWIRDAPLGRQLWEQAARRFRALGHDRYLAYALALRSVTYVGDVENHTRALALCDEAIALARQVGERPLLAQALNIRGELTRIAGDDESALEAYREGLDLATVAGDEAHMSMFLGNLGFLAEHRGEFEEAQRLCREALRLCWPRGMRLLAAMNVLQFAGPELGLGAPERATVLAGAAEEAMRRLGVGMHPGDSAEHARVVVALRAELGEEEFARLTAEGAAMSLDEAVEFALYEDDPQAPVRRRRSRP